jgi:hypothetical protein
MFAESENILPAVKSLPSATQIAVLATAGAGAVATFVFSRRALRDHSSFGSPGLVALCITVPAFFGMLSMGWIILIPYTTLGILCLLLPSLIFLSRRWNFPVPRWLSELRQPTQINPTLPRSPQPDPPQVDPVPSRAPARPGKRIIPLEIKHPGKRAPQNRSRDKNL